MPIDFDHFIDEFKSALNANEVLTFYCNCKINYSGRAESFLPQGDRLIVIKSDNTLLVHQPVGNTPINYMKDGSQINIQKVGKHLEITSQNLKYKDFLEIEIWGAYSIMRGKLEDGQKLVLQGNEKDMSDMIYDNPELISKDFKPLSREEHTKYGFIDVFGHDGKGEMVIIECKRYTAGLSCVTQLRRYVEKMKELKGIHKVTGIIAAPDISTNAKKMLEDWNFKFKKVNPPKRLERYDKSQKSLSNF
ncbi:endonuclease NucS [Candidatus Woesearchaeota archaeon]|nr:MAG: endonuclease NucS [Candidatus Woesearchaeota archaeon]